VAYARGNEPLVFTWRRKTEDHHASLPLRLRDSLTQLVSLGEDSTTIYAEADLEIVQGVASEVKNSTSRKVHHQPGFRRDGGGLGNERRYAVSKLSRTVDHTARFTLNGEIRLLSRGVD